MSCNNQWTTIFSTLYSSASANIRSLGQRFQLRLLGIIYCAEGASCSATQGFKRLVSVCTMSFTDFSDFCGYSSHRLHPLFPLVSFQLGFSGIPENDEKTSISPSAERYTLTPFWDPFWSLFSEKVPFFPRRVRPLFASLRRNPARRVNLVYRFSKK